MAERRHGSMDQADSQQQEQQHRGALVFSAPVVKQLVSDQVRLPPNYVGVRRVRPSNSHVQNEFRGIHRQATSTTKNASGDLLSTEDDRLSTSRTGHEGAVVYKITAPNGVERRMTSREKKQIKLQLRKEREKARKEQKKIAAAAVCSTTENSELSVTLQDQHMSTPAIPSSTRTYHQLQVNKSAIEEELADLRGDRDSVPPVLLSSSMSRQAFRLGVLPAAAGCFDPLTAKESKSLAVLDDELARRWSIALKDNMESAENVRAMESDAIRPMPYQVVPEVWTRLRPVSLSTARNPDGNGEHAHPEGECAKDVTSSGPIAPTLDEHTGATPENHMSSDVCAMVSMHKGRGQVDVDQAIIVDLLHRRTNLHISCGAKFGCDLLLYDGRRDERHAFAGLRILETTTTNTCSSSSCPQVFPSPSPYDLTGYVRCLNTAGKLALLATVKHDELAGDTQPAQVAFVDLALEKIVMQSKRKRGRRDIGKNLAKQHNP